LPQAFSSLLACRNLRGLACQHAGPETLRRSAVNETLAGAGNLRDLHLLLIFQIESQRLSSARGQEFGHAHMTLS